MSGPGAGELPLKCAKESERFMPPEEEPESSPEEGRPLPAPLPEYCCMVSAKESL